MPKKIMNLPEDCVSEAMEGFLAANKDYVQVEGASAIRVRNLKDKPAMIVGGGSGHEPMFGYFVGENLADASVAGSVFTSPDPGSILQAAQAVDRGKGILFVYGNYSGDNMNFDIAGEMLGDMDIPVKTVRVWDDVASASKENYLDRRGIAGNVLVIKIAGAATASGLDLEEAYIADSGGYRGLILRQGSVVVLLKGPAGALSDAALPHLLECLGLKGGL